jgi:hypothetical protein
MTCAEHVQEQLRTLVAQRQALREREARRNELESNRLEIACRQRQLRRPSSIFTFSTPGGRLPDRLPL